MSIDVPRAGGWRAWNTAAERFERQLAAQVSAPVLDARVDSETRQGLDYVRIRVAVSVQAADVAEAVGAAWDVFQEAAGEVGGWDLAAARAEVHPAGQRPARIRPVRRGLPSGPAVPVRRATRRGQRTALSMHACPALVSFPHDLATGTR